MPTDPVIIRWLDGIRRGDSDAANALWKDCFPELVRFAREKLRGVPCRTADEEDIALSAMGSFYRAVELGALNNCRIATSFCGCSLGSRAQGDRLHAA